MRLILLSAIAICLNLGVFAGADSAYRGIEFVDGQSWADIVLKAKKERKFIFVDCYATWCGPCKRMEKEVYSLDSVGKFFNESFISVKVQMDSTKMDDEHTRAFYADARRLKDKYKVKGFPTMLFFNSDGKIVRSVLGAMPSEDLIKVGKDVQDPAKDYYTQLAEYRKGKRDMSQMAFMAGMALQLLNDTAQAYVIAAEYMRLLKADDWFSRRNIEFIRQFTNTSNDVGFSFFMRNADSIDRIMGDEEYGQSLVQTVIYKEIVWPEIIKSAEIKAPPEWSRLSDDISRKYNSYCADRVITGARADWALEHKDWDMRSKYLIRYVEMFGPKSDTGGIGEAFSLNMFAWDIFEHSNKSDELATALKWSSRAVVMDPSAENMDTYANLLYKMNRPVIAIRWESIAFGLSNGNRTIETNYKRMKTGERTWGTTE